MKRIFAVGAALVLLAGTSSAGTKQKWTAGWDNFDAPLNYSKSSVSWSVGTIRRKLSPSKQLWSVAYPTTCIRSL